MSRVGKNPVELPKGVELSTSGDEVRVKGPKGELSMAVNPLVRVTVKEGVAQVETASTARTAWSMAGTTRSLLANMVTGVTDGFERKLQLVGVGYRAQAQGSNLNLVLGLSHPVNYTVPEGISVETPSQTEILIKGIDRQKVGQVAAEIRRYRPPEPYKGKGVRFADEQITLKEAKKK